MTKGKIFLVDAGPGDPGLLTIRAKELISSAGVVVYDDFAHPDVLTWCRADCEKIAVGRRQQRPAQQQEEIESLLVAGPGRAGRWSG